tara:strand:+ start:430 stop:1329 length:900 start_codon:yes stop_codon:yes gene_type:complete
MGEKTASLGVGAARATASIDASGNVTANLTGNIGGVANATVRSGAAKGEAAIDGSGNVTANLTGTVGGTANATIKNGATRANTVIDSDNKFIGDLKAGSATVGGTAVNTVRDRATTAVSDYIVYSDNAQAGSSSGDGASILPTYIQTGASAGSAGHNKNKVVCVYKHDSNNLFLRLTCLLKQSGDTTNASSSTLRCRLALGITDITADAGYPAFASSDQPLGDVSVIHTLSTTYGSTFINQTLDLTKLDVLQIDGADLVNGRLYQLTVSLRGGVNAAKSGTVTVSMLAPTITATGVDLT